jgi:F420H(2)-dependent quinone reductase
MADNDYAPSSSLLIRNHVALYESTAGAKGSMFDGRPVVILTMTGARSGKTRKTPVMRVEHDGIYAAIASYAGASEHPQWYYNLLANPDVQIQDGASIHRLRAREVSGQEKHRWWEIADALNPSYANFRASSGRDIPILLLEPATG